MTKELKLQLQHQSFQRIFRVDFLYDGLVGSPCSPRDSQESSPAPQFKSISSSVLCLLYGPTLTSVHDHWENQGRLTPSPPLTLCCSLPSGLSNTPALQPPPGSLPASTLSLPSTSQQRPSSTRETEPLVTRGHGSSVNCSTRHPFLPWMPVPRLGLPSPWRTFGVLMWAEQIFMGLLFIPETL